MNKKIFRKRALAVAAATVTTAAALSLGMGGTTNADTFPLGDVNLDGKVDLKDAQLALRGALRISDLSDMQFRAADVNLDNKVDLKDAQKILRGALNIEKIEGKISDTTPTTPPITTEKPDTSEKPTETTIPTTAPAIQPTESMNYGVEGIDWEWRTETGMHTYCYCGEFLNVDKNGFLITSQEAYDQRLEAHFTTDQEQHIQDLVNSATSFEDFLNKYSISGHGGWILKDTTETYKVRLK